jgi:hypothetical protein
MSQSVKGDVKGLNDIPERLHSCREVGAMCGVAFVVCHGDPAGLGGDATVPGTRPVAFV